MTSPELAALAEDIGIARWCFGLGRADEADQILSIIQTRLEIGSLRSTTDVYDQDAPEQKRAAR